MNQELDLLKENTQKEEIIDLQKLFRRLFNFWIWFVISVIISLAAAYAYNILSTPAFRSSITLLIKEDQGSYRRTPDLVSSLDVFGTQTNLYNEIGIIKSHRLNYKTVEDLGLYISYNKTGRYRDKDVYNLCPFMIICDTSHFQAINVPVKIKIISSTKVRITCKFDEPFRAVQYSNGQLVTLTADKINNKSFDIEFKELFETPFFSFRVMPIDNITQRNINDEYTILFHDINTIANSFRARISSEPINKESTIVRISLVDAIPSRAIDYLNKLGNNYISMGLNEKNLIATRTIDFIDEQLSGITDSLSVIERDLEQFRSTNKAIDLSAQGTVIYQKLQTLEYEKSIEKANVGYYEYLLNYVKTDSSGKEIISPISIGLNNTFLIELTSELSQLYAQREELRTTSSPKNPYIVNLNAKIETLRKNLIEQVTQLLNNSRFLLTEKQKEINRVQAELQKLPETERELIGIKRMYTVNDQIYTFLLQKRAEAAISKASNIADHKVIDYAISESRIKPKKTQNYLIAFIIGLLIPASLIILNDLVRNTVKDLSDIESLTKIPVLGNVLHFEGEQVSINSINASVAESFRVIRTNLDFFVAEKDKKVIAVTSMHSSEGKSFCSLHLAYVFALAGKKTLLVGADSRKPDLGRHFNMKVEHGLSNFLSHRCNWEDIVHPSGIENFDFIAPGIVPPNPAELLSDQNVARIFENFSTYDIVIFDTSPLGIIADAAYIVRHADINLFVTRYYVSRKPNVKMINYIIGKLRVQHPAIICNDFRRRSSKYYYYYYYSRMKVKGDHYYNYTKNQENSKPAK